MDGLAGMATHLSPEDQTHMLALFQAFARLDGRSVAEAILAFSQKTQVGSRCCQLVLFLP